MDIHGLLKTHFGYESFREGQEPVIEHLLSGGDVLAVMPTGAGKSVLYQIPALAQSGIALVISPLISLMRDQVAALKQAGVRAAFLNSTLTPRQQELALDNAFRGLYKIIYVAPERLASPAFLAFARATHLSLVAVDEAHCVSQWGQDFRPSYLDIAGFLRALPQRVPVLACTATATERVRADIRSMLGLSNPLEVLTGFDRPNLFYQVRTTKKKLETVLSFAKQHPGESGIVYCATRKAVEEVCAALNAQGVASTRYHAGLSEMERRQNQDDFLYDRALWMVATNAFGMGIDKPNVRYVVHYQLPRDLESYYQEAGRAGRDGERATCLLLFSPQDVSIQRHLISLNEQEGSLDAATQREVSQNAYRRLAQMADFAQQTTCLRNTLLQYFGTETSGPCGNCGNCQTTYLQKDITREARLMLQAVCETGERFGLTTLVSVLCGGRAEKLKRWNLTEFECYGALRGQPGKEVRAMLQALLEQGLLRQSVGQYPVLEMTDRGREVLRERETVLWTRAAQAEEEAPHPVRGMDAGETAADASLFERLRKLRASLAKAQGVPSFVVFSDASLRDMCRKRPDTPEAFLQITGVGEAKLARYGDAFLQAIRQG